MQGVSGRTLNGGKTEVKLKKSFWIRSSFPCFFAHRFLVLLRVERWLVPSNSSS